MSPTTVEIKLEDVLVKIDNRLERIESDLTDLKIAQAEIKGNLAAFQSQTKGDLGNLKTELTLTREDVKDLRNSQRTQIWVLIVAVVSAIIKFGFFPNS